MELGDPPFLPLGQGLIVDMGVTDEEIVQRTKIMPALIGLILSALGRGFCPD